MIPVISFVGRHDSGKTTLLTQIVKHFDEQNIKVGVIKHAYHELEISNNKDSEKLFNAGAKVVYTSSPNMQIVYSRLEVPELKAIIEIVEKEVDFIILEGYKEESYPKIEILRQKISEEPLDVSNIIARILDFKLEEKSPVPEFNFEQISEICRFVLSYIKSCSNS